MAGGFFIAVCVALYAYEYGNLPETTISVKCLFATCAGHILISKVRYCSFIVAFITV